MNIEVANIKNGTVCAKEDLH